MALPFKDISYAQGMWNMDNDTDPIVAMKASGFYTSSKIPYLDTQLVRNYANAIRLNKVPILYHFAGGADALTEAKYYIEAVSPLAEGDIYALDWEIDVPNPVQWVLIFVNHVHDVTGCWPWVYIDRSRRDTFNWSPVFANCAEWIAAPDVPFDANIPGIGIYMAQQGPIVNGVDTDEFFGTLEGIKKYGYHKPVQETQAIEPTQVNTPVAVTPPVQVEQSEPPVSESQTQQVSGVEAPTQDNQVVTPQAAPIKETAPKVIVSTPARLGFWQELIALVGRFLHG